MPTFRRFASDLLAASLPFVHRVFRGQRGKRYVLVSLAFTLLTVLLGTWVAFGSGDLERDLRHELGLEQSVSTRARETYTDISFDREQYQWAMRDRERLIAHLRQPAPLDDRFGHIGALMEQAKWELASAVSQTPPHRADLQQLHDRAARLLEAYELRQGYEHGDFFDWHDPHRVRRLQAIVDAELVPNVELYASPLTLREGIGVIGFIAGAMGLLALLVGAPLFAGAQIAQEAHENTLQPLLGTRLTPRGLVIGLTMGPLAAAAVFAAPQLLVCMLAGLTVGHATAVPGFLLLTVATSLLLTMLTQLLGYGMGRRWASGLVATVLTAMLVISSFVAIGIAAEMNDDLTGFVTLVPQTGSVHLLFATFAPRARLTASEAMMLDLRLVFATVAFAVLGFVTLRALERRITGRLQAAVTRVEAIFAAVTLVLMAVAVVPEIHPRDALPCYFLTLALLLVPLQLLLMGRVPTGDGPAKLRTIPLRRLLGEYALWIAIHGVLVVSLTGGFAFSFVGAFYLVWAVTVAALVSVHVAAIPLKPLAAVGAFFALFCAVVGYGLAAAFFASSDFDHGARFFGLFELSAVLGILQLVVTLVVPWSLVRALRRGSAGFC